MPRFAANLSMLFTDLAFPERFKAAAKAGFTFVEYLFPYEFEPGMLAGLLKDNGLTQVLFNLPAGNWAAGDRGIAADPQRVAEFKAGVDKAVTYAKALGVPRLNCLAGKTRLDLEVEPQWDTFRANLIYAAKVLAAENITLLIECINPRDIPGFLLTRTDRAMCLINHAGSANLKLQYDVYHAQRQEGELTGFLRENLDKIGHVQIADNPGRHQPGTGEINYRFLLGELDRLGYQGYVGLEYVPAPDTLASLAWIREHGFSL